MAWWFLPECLRSLLRYFEWVIKHTARIEKWLISKRDSAQAELIKLDEKKSKSRIAAYENHG